MAKPPCSNFRMITANVSGVQFFRNFTVLPEGPATVMILSFQTDMSGQTVQTQIRLLRVYNVCHSVCIVWTYYSMVEPHSSNFRVITTNVWGVRIFKKLTVIQKMVGCSGLTSLSTIFQSYHDGVWLQQGAQSSLL